MSSIQHSTSFWLVVNTFVLALASSYVLEFTPFGFEIANQSDRLDVIDKIDQFPKNDDSTILMLGSSLGIFPAALSDFKFFGEPKPGADKFLHYCSYRYLDKLLSASSNQPFKTLNLSHQGGMTSEDLLLLKGSLKAGIRPRLVILLTGPRDFLDHQTNKIWESKLAKALVARISDSIWNFKASPSSNLETLSSRILPIYDQRDAITKLLATKLKRLIALISHKPFREKPALTGGSLETIRDEPGTPEMMEFYQANYKIRYLPIDWKRWEEESAALEQISEVCRKQNIPLLLVAMPLSVGNKQLLPQNFTDKHRAMLRAQTDTKSRKNPSEVVLLDLFDSKQFELDDYMDSVHLRSSGGMKLAKLIEDQVEKTGWFAKK